MGTDKMTWQVQLDPTGRIAQDIPCIHCGYNLRSLLPDQTCPECGKLVESSLRGDMLRFGDPRWLGKLSVSMACVLLGSPAMLAGVFGLADALSFIIVNLGASPSAGRAIASAVILSISTVGIWLATSPEPRLADTPSNIRLRWAARLLMASFVALVFTTMLRQPPPGVPQPMSTIRWMKLANTLEFALRLGGFAAFFLYISPLGKRAGAPRLGQLSLYVAVALALLGLVAMGVSIWLCLHVQAWFAGAPDSIFSTLRNIEQTCFLLGEGLVLLVVVLYTWLLGREARRARRTADATPAGPIVRQIR